MSETEKTNIALPFMSETDIAALSVSALSDRPNEHSGQYGRKGLTPAELKAAFSALPVAIAGRLNELLPQIIKRFEETETACGESNEALRVAIMEAVAGLDGALKSELLAAISGKLDRQSGSVLYRTVYAEGTDGNTEMVRVSSTPAVGGIVSYGEDAHFSVAVPTSPSHPVTKNYFDSKSNNSLYSEVTDALRRVQVLEHSANGNIYENVTLSGTALAVQVKNACPYGIISRIGDNVATISVDGFYDLSKAVTYAKTGEDNSCRINGDGTVTIPAGRSYYIEFPCYLPAGVIITVNATGENSKGEKVSDFTVNDGTSSARVDLGKSLKLDEAVTKLRIWKDAPGTATAEELTVGDILITVDNPALLTDSHLRYPIDEYSVPDSVLDIGLYEYFDLSDGTVMTPEGEKIAVEIAADSDVFAFKPNAVIRFTDEKGDCTVASYTLNYKNKL